MLIGCHCHTVTAAADYDAEINRFVFNIIGNRVYKIRIIYTVGSIGTMIYNQQRNEFVVRKGPIFANFILADEINRAPAKVQSALLEAMQEKTVTVAGRPRPHRTLLRAPIRGEPAPALGGNRANGSLVRLGTHSAP